MTEYKIIIVGGAGVGKSSLVIRLIENIFVGDYDPTIEDNYRKVVTVDGETCLLDILDTAGQEEYRSMRDSYIKQGQGFILTYSITSQVSLEETLDYYHQIIRSKDSTDIPIILVGNKCDLKNERIVSHQEGKQLADELHIPFVETSAHSKINVENTFFELVRSIRAFNMQQKSKNNSKKFLKNQKCFML